MQNLGKKCVSVCLMVLLTFGVTLTTGCSVDKVIAGLNTADAVAQSAEVILAPVNPEMTKLLAVTSVDLETAIKGYQDYETALPQDKATKGDLVKATISAIQTNLASILADVGVKNPDKLKDISIGVAVINSAVMILLGNVITSPSAQAAVVGGITLPVIEGAKSAKDLKNAWNAQIKASYPNAVVK